MSGRKKRDLGGIIVVDELPLRWSIKSEPMWHTTDGDIGMRLRIVKHDEATTRHGTLKAWRELVLQYPFDAKQNSPSRFPERPNITPEMVTAGVRLALEAGWIPDSRGRPFELVLEESDLVR
jgi:hypothetical protein